MWESTRRLINRVDGAGGGIAVDVGIYSLSTAFAVFTGFASTLASHRAWGQFAAWGYGVAVVVVLVQHKVRGRLAQPAARLGLAAMTWLTTTVVPLITLAVLRQAGQPGRAQEEVVVVEDAARRILETGTPYLARVAIETLPVSDRLLGYLPYQPGMALFGMPRALAGAGVWTDARVWFATVSAAAVVTSLVMLGHSGARARHVVRAAQVTAVLPVSALTLATGGDDLPVLAACLLAVTFAATSADRGRWMSTSGVIMGVAAALKLFAWPVAVVLGVHAATRNRRTLVRFAVPAVSIPIAALLPALLIDPAAVVENVVVFPAGRGVVSSPAQSPLPGHLITTGVPHGAVIVTTLIIVSILLIAVGLVRHPPRTAASVSAVAGWGLLVAILLMPTTRFGYLLYPIVFLTWSWAMRIPGDGNEPERDIGPMPRRLADATTS